MNRESATAFVFNPRLTESQLFDYMMADFGIDCKSREEEPGVVQIAPVAARPLPGRSKRPCWSSMRRRILSRQMLEEIRLLTNLETSTEKLLQIVLAGQPELEQKLNSRELRQLRQRIALRAKTLPLTQEETSGYIFERLRIAGGNGEEIFTPAGGRSGSPTCSWHSPRNQPARASMH